jgi:hypothetical protein
MILVKVLPMVPGHFTRYEWIAVGVWAALGVLIRVRRDKADPEPEEKVTVEKVSA